jgi:hypothetical protein
MILPTKHIKTSQSVVGLGAAVLNILAEEQTLTRLWESARLELDKITFERFVLTLDFLYMLGCIELTRGLVRRRRAL